MLERDSTYKKDHKENIKLFRDLKSHPKYSLYATELNRVFGERSYDQFYKGLLENKKSTVNNFKKMFEKPVVKGGIKKIEAPFNINIFTSCLKKMKLKSKELDYKIKHPHMLNSSHYKYSKEIEKKLKDLATNFRLPDIPDIGRYNPNYDSVRAHPFYPIFAPADYENFNKNKKNEYAHNFSLIKEIKESESNKNIRKINLKKSRNYYDYFSTDPNLNKSKESIDKSFKSSKFNISQLMSTSSFGDDKNNHCLRFDSYSPRKAFINSKLYSSNNYNSSTNYGIFHNLRGIVDLSRSSNSKYSSYFDEVVKNNNNPPLGMYQPNYDYISKKTTTNIFLNKRDPPSPKLMQLKKIITSYNVSSEYKSVSGLNNLTQRELDKTN